VICLGLGSAADDLAAELLVGCCVPRPLMPGISLQGHQCRAAAWRGPGWVSIVYLLSAFPSPERDRADSLIERVQELLPYACVVRFCVPESRSIRAGRRYAQYRTDRELARACNRSLRVPAGDSKQAGRRAIPTEDAGHAAASTMVASASQVTEGHSRNIHRPLTGIRLVCES